MGIWSEIKKIINAEGEQKQYLKYIILLGMFGLLFLLYGNIFLSHQNSTPVVSENSPPQNILDYEEALARDLEEMISLIKGVGRARVKIYTKMDTSYNYEYNQSRESRITEEADQNGGERVIKEDNLQEELVILQDAGGNERPVVKEKIYPEITGVLIVAEGAERSQIRYEIVHAVSSLLDLPVHKISVLPSD